MARCRQLIETRLPKRTAVGHLPIVPIVHGVEHVEPLLRAIRGVE